MSLIMPSPTKHPDSGMYYFRVRVPADIRAPVGKRIIKESLHTKDAAEARVRFTERYARANREWAAQRAGPQRLTHREIVALAGTRYQDNVAILGDDPERAQTWKWVIQRSNRARETPEGLEEVFGKIVDLMLDREGLVVDAETRATLLEHVCRADTVAAEYLMRNSEGDYSPDPKAQSFGDWKGVRPVAVPPVPDAPAASTVTLNDLFDAWKRDHLANGKRLKTVGDFQQKLASFTAFIGHEDAEAVTPKKVAEWVAHLRFEEDLSARTVSDKYLATIRALYRLGMSKILVADDPTRNVKVTVPKAQKTREKGFTDAEAVQILTCALDASKVPAAMSETNRLACRWVPWICAYSGARGGEISQLRREDLLDLYGIPYLRITPEAGSVKSNAYRLVPLHPHLIDLGLVAMIKSRPEGPLFYPSTAKVQKDGTHPSANVRRTVGMWVRKVAGIGDPKLQPNHAWRHKFKTLGREHGIENEYSDAITGHEDGRAATSYGEMPIKAMYREIQKLPRYAVSGVGYKAPLA